MKNKQSLDQTLTWAKIGVTALGISGLYSIILVFLRTPGISNLVANKDFFKTALIIHVDLSVLVWLLAGSVMIWLKNIVFSLPRFIHHAAFMGIILMAISPIFPGISTPVMNNYVPLLDNILFIAGLSIFVTIILLISLIALSKIPGSHDEYAGFIGAIIFIISAMCIILSYQKLVDEISYPMDLHGFYEMLFWSGGHALQFLYMHTMYVIWITLVGPRMFPRIQLLIMWVNVLAVAPLLPLHFICNIDSAEFIGFCTEHMKYAGGVSAACMICSIIAEIIYSKKESSWLFGINFSLLLFTAGGVIGILIAGVNVTIPAHYHGSIVGISIAVMTLVYATIELQPQEMKWARLQVIIYSIGQMMHIGGLAWSGGYGVLRKNPDMVLSMEAKISMGIMGLGGFIAIMGGLVFVVICANTKCRN